MSYNKKCIKLLPLIGNYEKYTTLYTEFNGNYEVGDKLYIMVVDNNTTDYYLDSINSSGYTYSEIGYELLSKDENKLVLDIEYELLPSGLTLLTSDNCYIGRVYIKSGEISNGTINGTMLYNVTLNPTDILNLKWKQGVIVTSPTGIGNINFITNNNGELLLKTELLNNTTTNSYYTINNKNIGLSIVNLSGVTLELNGCNFNAGVFKNCTINGTTKTINNGDFTDCIVGKTYTIKGGFFTNCELEDNSVSWLNGNWDSSGWDGTGTNPFKTTTWTNGKWVNGIFPAGTSWVDGRFVNGEFNGNIWLNGTFGTIDNNISFDSNLSGGTTFNATLWENGYFNGGSFANMSNWNNGTFNNGTFSGSTWIDGTFNNGTFSGSTWADGTFNNGTFTDSTWSNGTFTDGTFSKSNWVDGDFNDGIIISDSTWENGNFYNGKIDSSVWKGGNFYKGSMFSSDWENGNLFFGVMNNVDWSGGTWYNGIANSVNFYDGDWMNGIFNYGNFYKGHWYNGSFNAGYFSGITQADDSVWYGGNFYFGEFYGVWSGGTFYEGVQQNIPQRYIIGRKFVQYNKSGLLTNRYKTVRIPSKRKF